MGKPDVLIVGYGVVGHNLHEELKVLDPDVYDIKYKELDCRKEHYDFAFICVDTPRVEDKNSYIGINDCDISQVFNAIKDNNADIYILKSTVLPGTTETLRNYTFKGKRIIFSPEYYGGTQHCNNFEFNFTILGGEKEDCIEVQQLLQKVYDARHTFRITDSTTAELAKYMENSWLATKVSFCNEFARIADKAGVKYDELRELFILDPRVNPSHTFVYKDKPYWDSHCLNKDVPAIANTFDSKLLKGIIDYNEECKSKK